MLNFFLATVFSTIPLISFRVAGNSKLASKSPVRSFLFPTHILIALLLSINSFCFLSFRASIWKRIILGLSFKLNDRELNFKNIFNSFKVEINEVGPKI